MNCMHRLMNYGLSETLVVVILTVFQAKAGEFRFKFMDTIGDAERKQPHVQAQSRTVSQEFLNGQWQGTIAVSDGKTYFGLSSHSLESSAT